jgi:hypothetical protein
MPGELNFIESGWARRVGRILLAHLLI